MWQRTPRQHYRIPRAPATLRRPARVSVHGSSARAEGMRGPHPGAAGATSGRPSARSAMLALTAGRTSVTWRQAARPRAARRLCEWETPVDNYDGDPLGSGLPALLCDATSLSAIDVHRPPIETAGPLPPRLHSHLATRHTPLPAAPRPACPAAPPGGRAGATAAARRHRPPGRRSARSCATRGWLIGRQPVGCLEGAARRAATAAARRPADCPLRSAARLPPRRPSGHPEGGPCVLCRAPKPP